MRIGVAKQVSPELASTRFRLVIPSRNCKYPYELGEGDITIFPKHTVTLEEAAKHKGPTIWDVCDDHFDDKWADYYRTMPKLVTKVTCTTDILRERIWDYCSVEAVVISDPLEFATQTPWVGTKRLFWYGHSSNLQPLLDLDLSDYEVRKVSNTYGCEPWSPRAMMEGYKWCDAVIIPIGGSVAKKDAKSPNRMTEAINAGRFVIANDIPSYREYGMYLGDIQKGLEWLRKNQQEALNTLMKAQKLVWDKHNPKAIGKQWESLFDSILGLGKRCGQDSSM